MNNESKQNFLFIISNAIEEADRIIKDAKTKRIRWLEEDVKLVKKNFVNIKTQVISDELQNSEGAGLGITRALSEMEVPRSLYDAGKAIEDFYKSNL